jgi:hypothetical protein
MDNTEEYNGTAWTAGGNLNTARRSTAFQGIQTSALLFGGTVDGAPLSNATEEYDGTSWINSSNYGNSERIPFRIRRSSRTCFSFISFFRIYSFTYRSNRRIQLNNLFPSHGCLGERREYGNGRNVLAGAGTQTAALAFGGSTGSPVVATRTEEYNGSSWSPGGSLGTARYILQDAGTQTAALVLVVVLHQLLDQKCNRRI